MIAGQVGTHLRDVRYAFRSLRKSPGFAAAAILTLALGIGANTAIFSVLQGVVLAPLPYSEPDRLVAILLYNRSLKYATELSYPDFLDWRSNAKSFRQIAAFTPRGFDLTSPGAAEHVAGEEISSNFFGTLGVKLALGREFSPQEDRTGSMPAVVISSRLWQDRFGRSPAALGKLLTLNGAGYTVVGVLGPDFHFESQRADVYTPIGQGDPAQRKDRTIHNILCVARLREEVSIGQARAEMNTVQEHIDQLNPATERGLGIQVDSLKQFLVGDVRGTLLLLLGAVGLVLLIACANVANLLLARSAGRTREFAVRLALGAGRIQIARQLITESVLLSLIGGALGLAFAEWGLQTVLAAGSLPRSENIGVNAPVLFFAFGVSLAVGIAFGLLPALRSSKASLQTGLKEGGRGSAGGHQRTQGVLVIVQIALALVLLSGASLLLRTIRNLWAVNPGFEARQVITFQVGLSPQVTATPSGTRTAYRQLTERIRRIPGVQAADITALLPLSELDNSGPFWVGSRPASIAEAPRARYYWIGPDYFRTMGIPLLRGRFLGREDSVNSEPVIVIDSALARAWFPDKDPVGESVTVHQWGRVRIVGVVGHVKHDSLDGSGGLYDQPEIYASFYQLKDQWVPIFRRDLTLAVRTKLNAATVMPLIKSAVYGVGGGQPVYNIRTMQELVSASMARQRFPMILLAAFAVLALLLACVGIYGVISYSMTRRVREIGIRVALGAMKRDVLRMVLGQGLRLALTGVATGTLAALILTRVLSSFSRLLYGVQASDPFTFIATSLLLIGAAILACYLPAFRAARLDPMMALRHE